MNDNTVFQMQLLMLNDLLRTGAIDKDLYTRAVKKINSNKI